MTIRFAAKEDIPGLIRLLRQVGQVHHEIRPDIFRAGAQKYDEAALSALLRDPNRPVFAAMEGDAMLGYAFGVLQEVKQDGALADRKNLYIDDLCVDEGVRGKGVAKALYDAVLAWAREHGCDAVTLNVWCGNDRAMAFYEKCGLKPQKVVMETIL